jgi:flagellar secretion chaperone FliS
MVKRTQEYIPNPELSDLDPGKLIELLFQRGVRDLQAAAEAWDLPDSNHKAQQWVLHAQKVVRDLQFSLNYKEGGEIAFNLGRIYNYVQEVLFEVLTKRPANSAKRISEVAGLIETLSSGWSEMLEKMREQQPVESVVSGTHMIA